jgi:hypothetical protein
MKCSPYEGFFAKPESMKQQEKRLQYERFRILARDSEDQSYYVAHITNSATKSNYFCWCNANQKLKVGNLVDGCLFESSHIEGIPLLVIK